MRYGRFLLHLGFSPTQIGAYWEPAFVRDGKGGEMRAHVATLEGRVKQDKAFSPGCATLASVGGCPYAAPGVDAGAACNDDLVARHGVAMRGGRVTHPCAYLRRVVSSK